MPDADGHRSPLARLYVMAKAPSAGAVKTRLCPPLAPAEAARAALAFAKDTLALAASVPGLEVRLALAGSPGSGPAAAAELAGFAAGLGVAVEDQGEGDLGVRMRTLIERGLAAGLATMLVGSDVPDLPRETIVKALDAFQRADVVLAPARDGGYVLVGARRRVDALFEIDAPWSSERVFVATGEALSRAGCAFETLDAWEDVDDAAALGRLARRLEGGPRGVAPESARLIARWRQQGVPF